MRRAVRIRVLALTVVLVAALPGLARAVTIEDIVALSKARVADPVLVAVIDADHTVFTLTPQQIIELRNSGVSNAVLVKMLGSAREFAPAPEPSPVAATTASAIPYGPVSTPTAVPSYDPTLAPAAIVVPYYVAVPVRAHGPQHGGHSPATAATQTSGFGRFINDGWNNQIGTGGFINNGWITATPETQPRTPPPPIRTMPPARETPPPLR